MLRVYDDAGLIGTIDIEDGEVVASSPALAGFIRVRMAARGMTAEQAYDDAAGWSNGYVWIRESADEPPTVKRRTMTPDLSRRAASALHLAPPLSLDDREDFVEAVSAAENVEDLPTEWRDFILKYSRPR